MPDKQYIPYILGCALLLLFFSCGINKSLKDRPDISIYNNHIPDRYKINDSTYTVGNSFLTKNTYGLWELYLEGDALELGLVAGQLSEELIYEQETVFMDRIKSMVPSEKRQKFIKKFLSWYNRKMYQHVPEEYKTEIYGLSRFMSADFNTIAPPYLRALYLHGAHDIGHALQDLALVGCSSFATWDEHTEDGQLLIARNFDFYAGDDFAKNKLISFVNPDKGYRYMSFSWSGFIGVVSGMNEKGLTVTINAGKSKIPWLAKTPISIVTREILQYASTIEEAIAIAEKRAVFVSEAIMVGSAADHKAVIIEISPKKMDIYEVENDTELLCANHFQSAAFKTDRRNKKAIKNSHSLYRYQRMDQLLSKPEKINVSRAVDILRDTKGLDEIPLGYGNEKALNQLLAHHGIVFKPEELKVWVSTNPYQLGEFVAYDLNTIFNDENRPSPYRALASADLNIPSDPFLKTEAYINYEKYRKLEDKIIEALSNRQKIRSEDLENFTRWNPEYWQVYYLTGLYFYGQKNYALAALQFQKALTKEITTLPDAKQVAKYLKKSKRKAK